MTHQYTMMRLRLLVVLASSIVRIEATAEQEFRSLLGRDTTNPSSSSSSLVGGVPLKSVDDYLLVRRLGTGKFSDVFEGVDVDLERKIPGKKNPTFVDPRTLVVIKCLKPVSDRKIRREVLVLERAAELPNLVRLLAIVVRRPEQSYDTTTTTTNRGVIDTTTTTTDLPQMPSLILQHAGPRSKFLCHPQPSSSGSITSSTVAATEGNEVDNNETALSSSTSSFLTDYEIRYYLFHLLVALDSLHSNGIMHRDVKPRNVLINRQGDNRGTYQPLTLIDLGLAEFYVPDHRYNVRVASRHYKSPELLIGYEYYDYSIDMWSFGCILAGLLLHREPYFRGKDNKDQLIKIITILGIPDLISFLNKYEIPKQNLPISVQEMIERYHRSSERQRSSSSSPKELGTNSIPVHFQRQNWQQQSFPSSDNNNNNNNAVPVVSPPPRDGIDLLDKLLVYDHESRWTARQAMLHPFFDIVRSRVHVEVQSFINALRPYVPQS